MDTTARQHVWVRLWGEFRLADGAGQPIEVASRKARALFALLAAAPEATVSRDRLAAMLWGDRSDTQARANLRQLLYELRPLTRAPSPVLGFDRRSAWLEPHFELDTDAQQRMDAGELAARLPGRNVAFLADLDGISEEFDEWLSTERAAAETRLRQAVQSRISTALAHGTFGEARALADAWCGRDATDETIAQLGLRADAALGDASGFARRMSGLENALSSELGVKPSAATLAVARELSPHAHAAVPPQQAPAVAPVPAPTRTDASVPAPKRIVTGAKRLSRVHAVAAVAVLGIAVAATFAWRVAARAPSPQRAEAASLTANARELSHGRARAGYFQAAALARRAIAADPDYAPAWAELALATWLPGGWAGDNTPASSARRREEVFGYLDRAIALDARLGRALAVRGMILLGDDEGMSLLEAAVREAPDDAEAWLWLSNALSVAGRTRAALDASRRAAQLDPLWDRSAGAYVLQATEYGAPRSVVDGALDRFESASPNRFASESLRERAASLRGDLVAAAAHGVRALELAPEDPWIEITELAAVARAIGDTEGIRRLASRHEGLRPRFAAALDPQGAVARAEGDTDLWWQSVFTEDEARALFRAGRSDLLLALVAKQPRPLTDFANEGCSGDPVPLATMLVLALRHEGRAAEADSLAGAIRAKVARLGTDRSAYLRLDLNQAVAFALDGRDDEAVTAFARAVENGWRSQFSAWAVDPADEPAFAHLRGRPDFERVRARLALELAAMRPQVSAIYAQAALPVFKLAAADER